MKGLTVVSKEQWERLEALYIHCYCVYHEESVKDFAFHAERCDEVKISWRIQNQVAGLANDRKSKHVYFRNLMQTIKLVKEEA